MWTLQRRKNVFFDSGEPLLEVCGVEEEREGSTFELLLRHYDNESYLLILLRRGIEWR